MFFQWALLDVICQDKLCLFLNTFKLLFNCLFTLERQLILQRLFSRLAMNPLPSAKKPKKITKEKQHD